jgi:hypothetical protein
MSGDLDHVSETEHWILDRTAGSSSLVVTLSFKNPRSGLIQNLNDLRVARYNGSSWESHGGSASGDVYNGTVTSTTISSFSPFTLGSSTTLNPLPVSLLGFNATYVNKSVEVRWSVVNEHQSDHYSIEKSLDGQNWSEISRVLSTDQEPIQNYESVDMKPITGIQYYRLKQVDKSGSFVYYNPVSVRVDASPDHIEMYPNPAINTLHLKLDSEKPTDVVIRNSFGQVVYQMNAGYGHITVDISELSSGIYTVETLSEGNTNSDKLIKH